MATDIEDDYAYAAQALPTPNDTPYRTPRTLSRRSSRYGTPSPGPSSSPPPMPPDGTTNGHKRNESTDAANDESISILDPRRFTPTLHASLVSEILSLRRDLEQKNGFIENLETSLHSTKAENEHLHNTVSNSTKESRSLKRQLDLLEGGSSSAFGELMKERDEANENIAEYKRRLESSQRKVRSQEEEADRVHDLWARDKETWDGDKRMLERKLHIVEGRLKAVVEEVAAREVAAQAQEVRITSDSEAEDGNKDIGIGYGSDTTSVRSASAQGRMSSMSFQSRDSEGHNPRFSVLSGFSVASKLNGLSLADELKFDEEDEDNMEETEVEEEEDHEDDVRSVASSRHSFTSDRKAKRILGLATELASAAQQDSILPTTKEESPEALLVHEAKPQEVKVQYVDSATQFSPPPSPKEPPPSVPKLEERATSPTDNEANQRRKRVSISPPLSSVHEKPAAALALAPIMVSASMQTVEEPPTPPKSPISPTRAPPPPPPAPEPVAPETVSVSTQTEPAEPPQQITTFTRAPPPAPIPIPFITIHPPRSEPSTPKESILPPQFKNASCQVSIPSFYESKSASVQTDEPRTENRYAKLPPHLLPSAISSRPATPEPEERVAGRGFTPVPGHLPPKSTKRSFTSQRSMGPPSSPPTRSPPTRSPPTRFETEDAYPGNNDNGPLGREKSAGPRRPFRSSSLFAGFDAPSSDEGDEFAELDGSDSEYQTALSAPKPRNKLAQKHGKLPIDPPTPVPEGRESMDHDELFNPQPVNGHSRDTSPINAQTSGPRGSMEKTFKSRPFEKPMKSAVVKQPSIRRSALISSGAAAHSQRARSPSLGSIGSKGPSVKEPMPPFPVPTRSSSRRIPLSSSDGKRSPTPQSGSMFSGLRKRDAGKSSTRKNSLRKVRSAAAIPRDGGQDRQRSRSPPPLSASSAAPDSPQLPPMPVDEVTSPRYPRGIHRLGHRSRQPSTNTSNTGNASVGSSGPQTSVVEAIAQTMVGEWMWKYVRRRKSFGVAESPQAGWEGKGEEISTSISGNGLRHKRWVWLAPYERAVMWSSKQPTSGSALLGKSGRKLVIQSVLDVKDDTPFPKGAGGTAFNRSILILTPARALKFTATSRERHYVWLTALSFLSHTGDNPPDLASLPPIPTQEYEPPVKPTPSLRRNPIRDSIRVAKGKARPLPAARHEPIPLQDTEMSYGYDEPIPDAADPPNVPRFSSHGRKRSNTGPRLPPPGAFRNFSHQAPLPSNYSIKTTTTNSDMYPPTSVVNSGRNSYSTRTSEASAAPSANFFDAVGTVRMEAFVERTTRFHHSGGGGGGGGRDDLVSGSNNYRRGQLRKRNEAFWNSDPYKTDWEAEDPMFRSEDPFKGF
ncbi:MAG: hypothetical protein M1819_001044 [Sarea resinae]|nr:MAG: hypothetical protein M1819_001044 [Sarea resinae]